MTSFLRQDGTVWTTDMEGLILGFLAAEITARTGKDPGQHYRELTVQFDTLHYVRIDAPATPAQKSAFKSLTPNSLTASSLADESILAKLTRSRERCSHWGAEGDDRQRLVCRAFAVDREHLQALRGELQGCQAPEDHRSEDSTNRRSGPDRGAA